MSDLRTRIMAALSKEDQLRVCKLSDADIRFMADAVIAELGPIPDREFVDSDGNRWEWCGGQPGTWAWRITMMHRRTADE